MSELADNRPLLLASASPRRRELLAALGVAFEVRPADIDESAPPGLDATALARRLAVEKAAAVPVSGPAVVLGADTVVALDGTLLAKPRDAAEARAMLTALRGRTHRVVTGVAVRRSGADEPDSRSAVSEVSVTMRAYSDEEINSYVARGEPFDKAGGYGIQDAHFAPVARVEGCYCAVMGLGLWTTRRLLLAMGIEATAPALPRCAGCPEREHPESA